MCSLLQQRGAAPSGAAGLYAAHHLSRASTPLLGKAGKTPRKASAQYHCLDVADSCAEAGLVGVFFLLWFWPRSWVRRVRLRVGRGIWLKTGAGWKPAGGPLVRALIEASCFLWPHEPQWHRSPWNGATRRARKGLKRVGGYAIYGRKQAASGIPARRCLMKRAELARSPRCQSCSAAATR